MKNTNSFARRLVMLSLAQAVQSTPRHAQPNRTFKARRVLKQACWLTICLMLVCEGFAFTPGNTVMAQRSRTIGIKPKLPQRSTRTLRTEGPPQISAGAITDLEIQRRPKAFGLSAIKSEFGARGVSAPAGKAAGKLTVEEPSPLAPPLGNVFEGINFNEDANLNGFFQIPPDPSGAAGPSHVVNVVNSAIEWYTRDGFRENRQTLSSFFSTAPNPPQTLTFDPKVIYDQYANRFVVTTMERIEASGMIANQSRVYFAVSDDSDPNGVWHLFTLTTEEVINGRQTWADFPGLAVDSEAIYYTNNQFAHNNQTQAGVFQGQRLRIIAKAPFYTGGAAVANTYNPAALADANPAGDSVGIATTMQPTQMYGDVAGGLGNFLIAYSGLNDFVSGSDANLFVQIIQVDDPLAPTPTFTGYFSQWGTIQNDDNLFSGLPGAPQLGTTRRIATNDRRFSQHGVYRNGLLYCAAPTLSPASAGADASQVTSHWFILNPAVLLAAGAASDPPPTDQGNIGGENIAPGTFTFFPSVAVDALGDLAIGFAASAPSIYPGAYYTGRLVADPAGTTQPASALKAGQDFYIRDFTTSMTVTSRWGDYSGIWLDPSDEMTFWVFNEYARPRGTVLGGLPEEDGRWGTAWGNFALVGIPTGTVIISEFRYNGPNGANDEFIELYNDTDSPIVVADSGAGTGWALVSADNTAVAKAIIPNGTTIPARGHFLVTNSAGYSLGQYPSGNNGAVATTATGDLTYATDIPLNRGIALFRTSVAAAFTGTADRLDAVGPASETQPAGAPYREGTGLPDIVAIVSDYSWARRLPGGCTGTQPGFVNHNCTTAAQVAGTPAASSGNVQDFGNNVNDFIFVDVNGTATPAGNQRLGAPGPENLTSPIQRNATIKASLIDPNQPSSAPPNRVRNTTPDCPNNSCLGFLDIRRKFTNNTGAPVTRLRFRIMDISTFPPLNDTGTANDAADLRVLSSTTATVTITGGSMVIVQGTTLEEDTTGNPGQPLGGAFNSSLAAGTVTLATPIAPGASINVRFVFGVMQGGAFRAFLNVEALP